MNKLLWCLAFIVDVVIFSIVGIATTVWTMIESLVVVLVNFILALAMFYPEEAFNELAKVPLILFVLPVRSGRIIFAKLKQCYDHPIMLRSKEEKSFEN